MDSIKAELGEGSIRVAGIVRESIVDGEGYRYVIFLQGCLHGCPGCHNPGTHALQGGELLSLQELYFDILATPLAEGVTFSGGEPFLQAKELLPLARSLKNKGINIWCYTGYTLEALLEKAEEPIMELLGCIDVLVDGPFIQEERNLLLSFRGSNNQRLINMPASFSAQEIVIYEIQE